MLSDGYIRITIAMLRTYTRGELALTPELREELERAIEEAYAGLDCTLDDPTPSA